MSLSPRRERLSTGVAVLAQHTRTTPAVTMLAGIRAGAFYDPDGHEGTAALVARVLDRGSQSKSAADIADALDERGASLSVMAGRHQITVSATCLADDFETIFSLMADLVQRPAFDEQEVVIKRAELLTSILEDQDDPAAVAVDNFMARLYPHHPYGRRARGTAETVLRITRDGLLEFHRQWFGPECVIIVVVGDVEPGQVVSSTAREFGSWNVPRWPEPVLPPPPPTAARTLVVAPMMNKAQADIAYGFLGLRRADPDYYAGWVMNNALGQYALGGRLGDSIRERQGMAYYVYSTLDSSLAPGPLMVRAGVAPGNVDRTLASIDQELRLVRAEGLTSKELEESKRYLIGSIPRQLETNAAIAGFLLSSEFHGLGSDHDARLPGLIAEVTRDRANAVAVRLLDPEKALIVVAGPWQGPATGAATIVSASEIPAAAPVHKTKDQP